MSAREDRNDAGMDAANLYLEEVFSDRGFGTIRRMTPVRPDGSRDSGREVVYLGQAQLYTNLGPVPLSFEIEAGSLEEAVREFANAANEAVERTMKDLEEYRREAASSIIVPEAGAAGGLGGAGMGPGGLPPRGKIQLR